LASTTARSSAPALQALSSDSILILMSAIGDLAHLGRRLLDARVQRLDSGRRLQVEVHVAHRLARFGGGLRAAPQTKVANTATVTRMFTKVFMSLSFSCLVDGPVQMAGLGATVVQGAGESLREPQSLSKEALNPAEVGR
jgi:hypothetical protein